MLVEHAEQALGFAPVALDRIRDRHGRVHAEMTVLPGHRPEPADLPEQPLQRVEATAQVARQEEPGLLRQVQQDRAGFEHADRRAAVGGRGIDHRRHLVVGRDREECRLELLALADIDRPDGVCQRLPEFDQFFQQQRDLVSVRGRPVMQFDHVVAGSKRRRDSSAGIADTPATRCCAWHARSPAVTLRRRSTRVHACPIHVSRLPAAPASRPCRP